MKQSTTMQPKASASPVRVVTPEEMLDHMKDTLDAVARRAFEIFDQNGRRLGCDLEDWVQAESELLDPVQLEIAEGEDAVTVRAEVPGFTERDIEVTVEPRRITICGKRESERKEKKGKQTYAERRANQFYRAADLPVEVDAASGAVRGTYDRGIVTVTLPKADAL